MQKKLVPVIIAGGKGTRLWPLSRAAAPKQFMHLSGERTLYQDALLRASNRNLYEPPIVITNEEFRFLAAEQSRQAGVELSAIILEPIARNTAPAIAVGAAVARRHYGDDVIVHVFSSDHKITNDERYDDALDIARKTAATGKIVTFGIVPSEAATGYGYIETGETLSTGALEVNRFVEKPARLDAERMLSENVYLWNSGIFMFQAGVIISELGRFAPAVINAALLSLENATQDHDFLRLDQSAFAVSPSISIDYAVMEKTDNIAVVPSHFSWSDLGSWDAVWKTGQQDPEGNVTLGNATSINTKNSLIISRHSHLAVQGMNGIAVIASEDAIYVGRLDDSQNVGHLVQHLAAREATAVLTETHPTSLRPWGGYTSVSKGDRFQVKRLFVEPGKKLSLQMHHHRAEHWVCVRGTAEVTIGDEVSTIGENEAVYIPLGAVHRLANPGKILLEMIEVQTGSYLGEDDIVRLDDVYGRS